MTKSPPGVKRVVSVLNFFAEHPGQAFTFTEIVRALKLGRATCHALLSGLVEACYLYRNPDKTYVIGPALVALGRVANQQFSPLQAAQPELRKLADQFGVTASAVGRDGKDVVVLAKAGSGALHSWTNSPVGERLPLRVQFAAAFFAWSDTVEVEKWLGDFYRETPPNMIDEMHEVIGFAREYGFTFSTLNPKVPTRSLSEGRSLFLSGDQTELTAVLMSRLDTAEEYPLAGIISPVFDRKGQVAFVLTLTGFQNAVSGSDILDLGQALRESCDRVTLFIGGKHPIVAPPRKLTSIA